MMNPMRMQAIVWISSLALGLEQHVHFSTHKAGNTLDLVMTELGSKLEVTKCSPGPFWLDHCAADFVVKLPMFSSVQEMDKIYVRKLCELDYNRLIEDVHISDLLSMNNLSELVGTMEKNIQNALDSQAHLRRCSCQSEPEFYGILMI